MTEPVWTEAERLPNATSQTGSTDEPSHDGIEVRDVPPAGLPFAVREALQVGWR